MKKQKITNEKFDEVKTLIDEGISDKMIAKKVGIKEAEVIAIEKSQSFNEFLESKSEKVATAQVGYYRSLIAQKYEENSSLRDRRDMLADQVKYLTKSIKFLELRKKELETGIEQMEKEIFSGIDALEFMYKKELQDTIVD